MYPINLDYEKIEQLFIDNKVDYYFNCSNLPNRQFFKISLDRKGNVPLEKSYKICYSMSNSTFLKDGRIYLCPVIGNIETLNKYFNEKFILTDKDYIDIHNISNIDEILSFLSKESPFCRYCNIAEGRRCNWKKSEKSIDEWVKN